MKRALLLASGALAFSTSAAAQTSVVVPNAQTSAEGNSGSRNLFGFVNVGRLQQVYNADQFASGPITITGLALRANGATFGMGPFDTPGTSFSRTIEDIAFSLSTTSASADTLSTAFASNIGANVLAVIPRGSVTFSTAAGSSNGTTRDFDVVLTFANAFRYDPGIGNLLLDVTSFSGSSRGGTTLDAQSTIGDAVSSLYRSNGTTGTGTLSTLGYVTQFRTAGAVPEPASWMMMILGFGMIGGGVRRQRRRSIVAFD